MAKNNATSSKSSSLVMKLDNRPADPSSKTAKRRRMCVTQSYKSPLVHLRKSNFRRRPQPTLDDLDDSVIVLEEVTATPLLNNSGLLASKKRTVNPDESVIILSDNEENKVEKETDLELLSLRTVIDDDLSGENSAPAEVRKPKRKMQPSVKTRTTLSKFAAPEKESSTLGSCPNSDTVELQSISIDSEDENTIPNNDSSRLHPQTEIIIIDNSLIEISKGVSMSTISCSSSAGGYSRTATARDDISVIFTPRKEFQRAAEKFASLRLEKKKDKRGRCPAFCIDTKGDPSLAFDCFKGLSTNKRKANRKKALQNPNWTTFLENESSESLPLKKINVVDSQAQGNGIENCHRVETVVANGSSESLLSDRLTVVATNLQVAGVRSFQEDETVMTNGPSESLPYNKFTVVGNEAQVDGTGSYQGKKNPVSNASTENSHPHKLNIVTNQSIATIAESCRIGKMAVSNGPSKTVPSKKTRSRKIPARGYVMGSCNSGINAAANMSWQCLPPQLLNFSTDQPRGNVIGTYYSEQTVVNMPGSLREIIIDGCNIATQYTKGRYFSEEGLKLVIDYFELRGHTVKAFVPQHVRSNKNVILESLYSHGVVVFTPSRLIGGKRISSYDDRYILDYAAMSDGIVVSQDQYRDLYMEKLVWRRIIEERLLVPTFVGKCVMFPEDPLGKYGPTLDQFLRH